MKKNIILVSCALFILFALLGFFVASRLNSAKPQETAPIQVPTAQQNYLLILVDDLESSSPQLISLWGAFINNSDTPSIKFVPFFPTSNSMIADRLVHSFRLTEQGKLSNNFVARFQREYQIQTLGYIIVDNLAVVNLTNSFFAKTIDPQGATPSTDAEIHEILANGQIYFDLSCKKLGKQNIQEFLSKIDWLTLLPSHFVTSLSFESLTLATEQLSSSGPIEDCVVLGSQ